jgi:hypothetical protein
MLPRRCYRYQSQHPPLTVTCTSNQHALSIISSLVFTHHQSSCRAPGHRDLSLLNFVSRKFSNNISINKSRCIVTIVVSETICLYFWQFKMSVKTNRFANPTEHCPYNQNWASGDAKVRDALSHPELEYPAFAFFQKLPSWRCARRWTSC